MFRAFPKGRSSAWAIHVVLEHPDPEASVALAHPILSAALNHISLEQIKADKGPPPWSHPVALAEHVVGVVIYQDETAKNDNHCHTYDEFWVVLEGEIHWQIEGRQDLVRATAGDFVFVPARTFHHIHPQGLSVRVGIALPGHGHLHDRPARSVRVDVEAPAQIPAEGS
jgi:mannose-6-phosphate isomerase-like protein (cupin superfamily)